MLSTRQDHFTGNLRGTILFGPLCLSLHELLNTERLPDSGKSRHSIVLNGRFLPKAEVQDRPLLEGGGYADPRKTR